MLLCNWLASGSERLPGGGAAASAMWLAVRWITERAHNASQNFMPDLAVISTPDLVKAREFAIRAHGDQRYGGLPYSVHLADVVNVCIKFGIGGDIRTAAWLHDVLEDTATTLPELYNGGFSSVVCSLVVAVTNEPGKNRKERHLKTHPKIRKHGKDAVILKVADRIANTEFSMKHGSMLGMYRKEFRDFYDALYKPNECDAMWDYLKALSGTPEAA